MTDRGIKDGLIRFPVDSVNEGQPCGTQFGYPSINAKQVIVPGCGAVLQLAFDDRKNKSFSLHPKEWHLSQPEQFPARFFKNVQKPRVVNVIAHSAFGETDPMTM